MNSERYSRFTLQPSENGERHAEVNLSDYAADGDTAAEAPGSPSFRPAPLHHSSRTVAFIILGILMVFLGGSLRFLIFLTAKGWRIHKVNIFFQAGKINKSNASLLLCRDFDLKSRSAGSEEDMGLANRIFNTFKTLGMTPWTDIYYVQLQTPDTSQCTASLLLLYITHTFKTTQQVKRMAVIIGEQLFALHQVPLSPPCKGSSPSRKPKKKVSYSFIFRFQVHLGSGDPYTPGFPSFNHTLFAPMESAGLPNIPAQTITASSATTLLKKIGGPEVDTNSDFKGELKSVVYKLGGSQNITVEVNNVLVNKEIHNVFGVIKGFTDPDRYVVLGAQRDAWGRGYTKATVGTSVLIELAKAFQEMVKKDDFRPRRSIIFASWSAGEFGSVGATEWLEGYMSSLDRSVFTYINLDGVVMGQERFIASASPLLYSLIESTMKEPNATLPTMSMEDPAYPFLAFAGIPSMCFHFIQSNSYPYYGTGLDNMDHLNYRTSQRTSNVTATAAQFAGLMTLRLVHDHLLGLDVSRYYDIFPKSVHAVFSSFQSGQLKDVSPNWLNRARGSYRRAADAIAGAIANTDLTDEESCRILNDRIMKVEHSLLSPYVSVVEAPFRHLLLGRGPHTLAAIAEAQDLEKLRLHLALATWNLQGCANAMAANVWDIDDDI
uniref:Transferrin receptor 1b n=1 Tax=Xiphophorus couchianus TaxID=32473 RepID=A0A3B5MLD0_9TELE